MRQVRERGPALAGGEGAGSPRLSAHPHLTGKDTEAHATFPSYRAN